MAEFDEKKVTTFLHFILNEMEVEEIGHKKAIKLLYLCDRSMYAAHRKFITNDTYVSMAKGPVLLNTNSLMEISKMEKNTFFSSFFRNEKSTLKTKDRGDIDYSILSDTEKRIAQYQVDLFKDFSEEELIEFTHHVCDEWQNPEEKGVSIIPITVGDIKEALNIDVEQQ